MLVAVAALVALVALPLLLDAAWEIVAAGYSGGPSRREVEKLRRIEEINAKLIA